VDTVIFFVVVYLIIGFVLSTWKLLIDINAVDMNKPRYIVEKKYYAVFLTFTLIWPFTLSILWGSISSNRDAQGLRAMQYLRDRMSIPKR
jgi:hypothetical protein